MLSRMTRTIVQELYMRCVGLIRGNPNTELACLHDVSTNVSPGQSEQQSVAQPDRSTCGALLGPVLCGVPRCCWDRSLGQRSSARRQRQLVHAPRAVHISEPHVLVRKHELLTCGCGRRSHHPAGTCCVRLGWRPLRGSSCSACCASSCPARSLQSVQRSRAQSFPLSRVRLPTQPAVCKCGCTGPASSLTIRG